MALLSKRANGMYSLSFWWKGKTYIKALGTDDEQAATQIKKDAEEQLARAGHIPRADPFRTA